MSMLARFSRRLIWGGKESRMSSRFLFAYHLLFNLFWFVFLAGSADAGARLVFTPIFAGIDNELLYSSVLLHP